MSCFALSCAGAFLGCAPSAPARVALQGDLPSLKTALDRADHDGKLSDGTVRELAGAVLERELSSLHEPIERFPELGPCVHSVRGPLGDLAARSGEPAVLASVTLLDAGLDAPSTRVDDPASTPLLARRALGVRAGERRRAYLLHGDASVRRAALEAAADSHDPEDVPALLEAARVDPDESSRFLALRALGEIGGARVVVGLADLWSASDTDVRRRIVEAWAIPASFTAGGERELVRAAEQGSGIVAVAAALELVEQEAGPPGLAVAVLANATHGEDASARLLSLYESPWSKPELRAAVLAARESKDPATRLLALLRQAEQEPLDAASTKALEALAAERTSPTGLVARATLARAGDAKIKDGLRADLRAPHAEERTLAAFSLWALGESGAAAQALGDDSPEVRQAVACQVLRDHPKSGSGEREVSRARAFGVLAPKLPSLLLATPEKS